MSATIPASIRDQARQHALRYATRTGIWARVPSASNGIYSSDGPVFTYGPSDETTVFDVDGVGANWTCVGMVYPL